MMPETFARCGGQPFPSTPATPEPPICDAQYPQMRIYSIPLANYGVIYVSVGANARKERTTYGTGRTYYPGATYIEDPAIEVVNLRSVGPGAGGEPVSAPQTYRCPSWEAQRRAMAAVADLFDRNPMVLGIETGRVIEAALAAPEGV